VRIEHLCTYGRNSSVQHVLVYVCKSCDTAEFLVFVNKKQFSGQPFFTQESVSLISIFTFGGRKATVGCILLENRCAK
jgi:hypothetical protein